MPEKILEKFSVSWLQVMNELGRIDRKVMPTLKEAEIKTLYEFMVLSRVFDEKCLLLQRQGRMGTYTPVRGQEAAQVGSAFALDKKDWMFPAFRENAANLVRGVPPEQIMAYWAGDERGEYIPKDVNNFTVSVPVATQIPHAVGTAWGMKLRNEKSAALVYFGDGATSKGDFHEAMNWAGVFQLPVVFFCQNNQFAISLRVGQQTAAKTIAQKAIAYGFPGIRVDGNDVFAVVKATTDALKRARQGKGPTLIEAFTYRMEHHTTSDDSWRYRTKKEVSLWEKKDPITRLEKYLKKRKILTKSSVNHIREEAKKHVEDAVKRMEAVPPPRPEEMFDYVFSESPWNIAEEKEELKRSLEGKE